MASSTGVHSALFHAVIILDDGPPDKAEAAIAAPIPATEAHPAIRNSERREYVFLRPYVKERPLDGSPVAQQPRLDELRRADQVEAIHIPRIAGEENLVVRDPGRNDRNDVGLSTRKRTPQHPRLQRERMELIPTSYPVLAWSAGVAGEDHLHRDAVRAAQRPEQPPDGVRRGVEARLFDPHVGQVAALPGVRVLDIVEASESDAPAMRHAPHAVDQTAAEDSINFPAALDRFFRRHHRPAEHHGIEGGAVAGFFQCPPAQYAVGLAAAPGASEEYLREVTFNERVLRA